MLLVEALNRLSAVDLGEEDPYMCVAVYTWWGMIKTNKKVGVASISMETPQIDELLTSVFYGVL